MTDLAKAGAPLRGFGMAVARGPMRACVGVAGRAGCVRFPRVEEGGDTPLPFSLAAPLQRRSGAIGGSEDTAASRFETSHSVGVLKIARDPRTAALEFLPISASFLQCLARTGVDVRANRRSLQIILPQQARAPLST